MIVCGMFFDVVVVEGGFVVVEVVSVVKDVGLFFFVGEELVKSDCFELIVVKVVILGGCGM